MSLSLRNRKNDAELSDGQGFESELWRVNWKSLGYPYCGVYVITTDSLYPCKIGISSTPGKRIADLQVAHWRPIQISGYRWAENAIAARKVEKEAHAILNANSKRLMGEWFDIPVDKAVEAIDWAALSVGVDLRTDVPDRFVLGEIHEARRKRHWRRMKDAPDSLDDDMDID